MILIFTHFWLCCLIGAGQDCWIWTKDGGGSASPDLQWRQRERQVQHFISIWTPIDQLQSFSCNVWSVLCLTSNSLDHNHVTDWPNVFIYSPTPHLHFSIKHPHTLSWEYYKMFQCKAHLVMRLIENRISMEFMLQVRHNQHCLDFPVFLVIWLKEVKVNITKNCFRLEFFLSLLLVLL